MRYPLEKYKYFIHTKDDGNKEIIAMSTYGGRYIRGIAKCSPEDTYDEDIGKKLAAYRCNLKVAEKRMRAAESARSQAEENFIQAAIRFNKMNQFKIDAEAELKYATSLLEDLLNDIREA